MPKTKSPGAEPRTVGLRALREKTGLSRQQFIRRLTIETDPKTLQRFETDPEALRKTSFARAEEIANVLSALLQEPISVYDLFLHHKGAYRSTFPPVPAISAA